MRYPIVRRPDEVLLWNHECSPDLQTACDAIILPRSRCNEPCMPRRPYNRISSPSGSSSYRLSSTAANVRVPSEANLQRAVLRVVVTW